MLTYFPTPYPGEWWYSVLCRYFVRSGRPSEASARKELYKGRIVNHGSLFPGCSCALIRDNLPENYLKLEDILLNYTLLSYCVRMAPCKEKENIFRQCLNGTCIEIHRSSLTRMQNPKFCPICFQRDRARYGEAYWHRDHQIPLVPVCAEHKCRLEQPDVDWAYRNKGFIPLDTIFCPEPDVKLEKWEVPLAKALQVCVDAPYLAGPDEGCGKLVRRLISKGFGVPRLSARGLLDTVKLCQACEDFFYPFAINRYFESENCNVFYHIGAWARKTTERYALLAAFANLDQEGLF